MNHRSLRELLNAIVVLKFCTPFGFRTFEFLRKTTENSFFRHAFYYTIKQTAFKHFCAGENLQEAIRTASRLKQHGLYSILDWAAEKEPSQTLGEQTISNNKSRIVESIKNGSLINAAVAVKLSSLLSPNLLALQNVSLIDKTFLDQIMQEAQRNNVDIYFDAEHSKIQPAIDEIVLELMVKYPGITFNTYQMYLANSYSRLVKDYERVTKLGLPFACKLVRGAYMMTEDAAILQPSLEATHNNYNAAVEFLMQNMRTDSKSRCMIATHNKVSIQRATELVCKFKLENQVVFGQLLGMSDSTSTRLVEQGMKVYKYLPFGPPQQVLPYLSRRILENSPQFFSTIQNATSEDIEYFWKMLKNKFYWKR